VRRGEKNPVVGEDSLLPNLRRRGGGWPKKKKKKKKKKEKKKNKKTNPTKTNTKKTNLFHFSSSLVFYRLSVSNSPPFLS